jgi:glutamate N-acetyltransferase/amino-acid N-acetyltransferase
LSVTAAEGFVASGLAAGIKAGGRRDVSLLATDDGRPVPSAAVFTQNKFRAPPVEASLERLNVSGGYASGVIVNSGNANAGTGAKGRADSEAMCAAAAETVGCDPRDMLVCSTGLIGFRLPMRKILTAIPTLGQRLNRDGHRDAAKGILTTDTRPKEAQVVRKDYAVGGMAKGCGMLAPNMATMLAFLTTDARLSPEELKPILFRAADATFNSLITDGATSTNDTVMLFASGRKGRPADLARFEDDVRQVCEELMLQMARDAEGMTKLVVVNVAGAAERRRSAEGRPLDRQQPADQVQLVRRRRLLGPAAGRAGSCGVEFETEQSRCSYGGIKSPRRASKPRTTPTPCAPI